MQETHPSIFKKDNKIGSDGTILFARSLCHNSTLTALNLSVPIISTPLSSLSLSLIDIIDTE